MDASIRQRIFESFNNTIEGSTSESSNNTIVAAIEELQGDPSLGNTIALYEALRVRMRHRAQFIVPTPIQDDGRRGIGMVLDDASHTEYYVAFTGINTVDPSAGKHTASYGMKKFLEDVLVSPAGGIYINPKVVRTSSGAVKMTGFKLHNDGILSVLKAYYSPLYRMSSIKADITSLDVDAIVNATDENLSGGGGVDRAIHKAAGPRLTKECRKIGKCKTGEAVITDAYGLLSKKIIHTPGPVYADSERAGEMLASCYKNALELAKENNLHSIAFPAISTGTFGYPLNEASMIAFDTVLKWLENNPLTPLQVVFVSYSDEAKTRYDSLTDNYKDFLVIT